MRRLFLFCSALAIASPAFAEPYTYSPRDCEFQITFPEKPFIETKCSSGDKDCAEIATYTKAIGIDSSTSFRASCHSITASEQKTYTPEILEETLKQMIKSSGLEAYDSKSGEKDGYRNASAISLAERDGKALVYNGQIWAGKTSMFTLEAEMLGKQNDEIEKTFVDILKKTYPKNLPPKPETEKPKKGE